MKQKCFFPLYLRQNENCARKFVFYTHKIRFSQPPVGKPFQFLSKENQVQAVACWQACALSIKAEQGLVSRLLASLFNFCQSRTRFRQSPVGKPVQFLSKQNRVQSVACWQACSISLKSEKGSGSHLLASLFNFCQNITRFSQSPVGKPVPFLSKQNQV